MAALERRTGIIPGLAPLPGCDDAAPPLRATTITSPPDGRRPAWRARGRAALAAAALLAALAWLLRPLPGGPGYFPAAGATARPAAGAPATTAAPAEEPPARADNRAQHAGLSPAASQTPAAAPARPGVPPCLAGDGMGCASPTQAASSPGAAPACHGSGCLTP